MESGDEHEALVAAWGTMEALGVALKHVRGIFQFLVYTLGTEVSVSVTFYPLPPLEIQENLPSRLRMYSIAIQ